MKNLISLLPTIASTLTIIDFMIKYFNWLKKHPKETQKYGNLMISSLMLSLSVLLLILSACSFFLKVIETNLQTAFFVFFICIGFAVCTFLFARYHFKEFKRI